jgi:hypothetical protein
MDAFQVLRIAGFGYTFVSQSEAASAVINTLTVSFFNYAVMRAALGTKLTLSGLVGTMETDEASGSRILQEVPAATSKLAGNFSDAGPFVLDSDISKASTSSYPVGYSLQIRSERRVITAWDASSRTLRVKAPYSFLPSVGEAVSVRADFHAPFGNVGEWNRTAGTLVLDVQADSLAETVYTFTFQVRNPPTTNDAVDVYITSSKTFSPSWLLAAASGRHAPLMVIGLVHKHIGQSTAKPGAVNTITITISTTDSLYAYLEAKVHVVGLTGTATGNWGTIVPLEVRGYNNRTRQMFEPLANWTQRTGRLTVWLAATSVAYEEYGMSPPLPLPSSLLRCSPCSPSPGATHAE